MVTLFLEFMTQCPCTHVVHLRCIPHFILFHGFVGRQVLSYVGDGGGYRLGALGMVISFPAIQNSHAVKRDCNAANDF